jgi:hypothetical protein
MNAMEDARTQAARTIFRRCGDFAGKLPWAGFGYYDAAIARLGKWLRHFIPDCPESAY